MKILELVQGTDDWLEARLNHFTASEAPAMMNQSKYMSRNQLLDLKKGWQSNPDSSFKEKLYSDGHKFEDLARPIVEMENMVELLPLVGSREIQGMELLSSFDGLNLDDKNQWEHKGWNETLAENVRNSILEPHYYWQLEHQLLVSGLEYCAFTVSDGTINNMVTMNYRSQPERRLEIIAGWKQFESDLENHQLKAKQEAVVPTVIKTLPVVKWQINGTEITSNIANCLDVIVERSRLEMDKVLETDQDFADKDTLNKSVKKARSDLSALVDKLQREFVSYAEFAITAKEIDVVLQKMQSHGEKQVKEAKEVKKADIVKSSEYKIVEYVENIDFVIRPIKLNGFMSVWPDFQSAIKGKRTIESIQNACDAVVAEFKIEADKMANKVKQNLLTVRELTPGYEFLFADADSLLSKDNEDLIAVIKTRIAEHDKAEEVKAEALREEIRLEEEKKAENKVKRNTSVESWQTALNNSRTTETIEEIQKLVDFIENSPVSKEIFGERYDEAQDLYLIAYDGIQKRAEEIKGEAAKQVELERIQEKLDSTENTKNEPKASINEPKQEITEQKEPIIEQDLPFVDQEVPCETTSDLPETEEQAVTLAFEHWWSNCEIRKPVTYINVASKAFKAGVDFATLKS